MWTPEEDELLRAAVDRYGEDWEAIAQEVPGRNKLQCVQRWKKTLRPGLIKGPWKPEEDALLIKVMSEEMEGDWQSVSRRIPGRNAKQCKERWMLNLNPAINHGPWTPEEDSALIELHAEFGGKWSILAKRLTGRTEHAIKTRFLSLQKRAAKMRSWTVDEDRIVLKLFMAASGLNGVSATMKALPGRTKRQVQDRWRYLRENNVSIDDLATSNPHGGVALNDQDLRNLVPHPSLNAFSSAQPTSGAYAGSGFSASDASDERVKSLARRQGSSNPSQPFRHAAKRLEKSASSSSASQKAQAQMGSELLSHAFGSSMQFGSTLLDGSNPSQNDVVMTPMGPVEDPFVAGLINAGLQAPSMFISSSSSTSQNRPSSAAAGTATKSDLARGMQSSSSSSQGGKTLQHNMFSSSFLLPPLSPQPGPGNGEPHPVERQDSFLHRFGT